MLRIPLTRHGLHRATLEVNCPAGAREATLGCSHYGARARRYAAVECSR